MTPRKPQERSARKRKVDGRRRRGAKSSTAAAAVDRVRTEGQRLLGAVDGSHAEVAAAVGASKQSVSYWRRGEKLPGAAARGRIRDVFGIDPQAWDREPEDEPAPKRRGKGRGKTVRGGTDTPTPKAAHETSSSGGGTTLDEVERQLRILRELQLSPKLLASERVRLSDSVAKVLAIKARLERDQELLEDRIVREHPAWQRIRNLLVRFAEKLPPDDGQELLEELTRAEGA